VNPYLRPSGSTLLSTEHLVLSAMSCLTRRLLPGPELVAAVLKCRWPRAAFDAESPSSLTRYPTGKEANNNGAQALNLEKSIPSQTAIKARNLVIASVSCGDAVLRTVFISAPLVCDCAAMTLLGTRTAIFCKGTQRSSQCPIAQEVPTRRAISCQP